MYTLQILDRGQTFYHPLETGSLTVGSDSAAGLRLGEAEVLPSHLRLDCAPDGVRLVALGKVLVNGASTAETKLALGDRIEVGRAVLVVGRAVSRATSPDEVLADAAAVDRRPRERKKAKWLPFAIAGVLLAGAGFLVSRGSDETRVREELARVARLREMGQLDQTAAAIEKLRSAWEKAPDDRLQRLAVEQVRLDEIRDCIGRLTAQVLDPTIERSYAEWIRELKRVEVDGSDGERVAARAVRATLNETLARRPKPPAVPGEQRAEPDAVAVVPLHPDEQRRDEPRQNTTVAPAPAPAEGAEPAIVAEVGRLSRAGQFAQGLAAVQAGLAEARDPRAAAELHGLADQLRTAAASALQDLLAEAERITQAGRPGDAAALLTTSRHRFPATKEFAGLGEATARAEAAAAAAVAAAKVAPRRDESSDVASFAQVQSHMQSARTAEESGAFAEAARLLREAAGFVRDRDAAFAARLEARAEEADLLAAWHERVAGAVREGRPLKVTSREGRAVTLRGVDGSELIGTTFDGEVRLSWAEVSAFGISGLVEQLGVEGGATLGAATLLYRADDDARAESLLAKLLQREPASKESIDKVIAQGRGEPFDPRGYTLGKDGFVSVRSVELQKQAQKLAARLDSAMRDRDPAARDRLVTEFLAGGPESLAVLVAALGKDFERQVGKLDSSSLKKQVERLAAQRVLLDAARDEARSLIYDEVKYFYPYKPPAVSSEQFAEYNRVQAEVDRRVAALRTIWDDDRVRVRVPATLRADLERLDWTAKTLAELGERDTSLAARVEWARALPAGESVGVQDYCATLAERKEIEQWRRVVAYNTIVTKAVSSAAREQLKITNDYRAMFRHPPVALVGTLCAASQGHAEEMSKLGYFAHMSPTPGRRTPYDRMRLAGYTFGVSENIALNDSALAAHDAWCHSSGHHRNLLDPSHTEMGIGADGRYWVQNFGSGNVHEEDPSWVAANSSSR